MNLLICEFSLLAQRFGPPLILKITNMLARRAFRVYMLSRLYFPMLACWEFWRTVWDSAQFRWLQKTITNIF